MAEKRFKEVSNAFKVRVAGRRAQRPSPAIGHPLAVSFVSHTMSIASSSSGTTGTAHVDSSAGPSDPAVSNPPAYADLMRPD